MAGSGGLRRALTFLMVDESFAPLRIVCIGGGTGLSALLHGLKRYARTRTTAGPQVDIAAIVTVTDDGGSSGRLRRDFDVLAPGDIRNCMVALSEDEALLSRLFQYRFQAGRGLKGHSFGNLFLTALTHVTGDFSHAVRLSSEVLASMGRIYPSTVCNVTLEARLENRSTVVGETRISKSRSPIRSIHLRPRKCDPLPETLEAIEHADLITLGPGSLFTSVIPNVLVEGMPDAIRNSQAMKAYFVNLMWQPGETMQFTASDHVRALHKHAGGKLVDYVVLNNQPVTASLRRRYARQEAMPVQNDFDALFGMGLKIMAGNLLINEDNKVRHNPEEIAAVALKLAIEGRQRKSSSS
jgi:uncharacterized cofD-like protein